MTLGVSHPARRFAHLVLMLIALVASRVAGGIGAVFASRERTAPDVAPQSEPDKGFCPYRRQATDDSGFTVANHYARKVRDPLSLEHVRDCYDRIGYRGIEEHERELAQSAQRPEQELKHLLTIAQLALYEGDHTRAADTLAHARSRAATDPERFCRHVTTGSSFGANPQQQTIGLGKATVVSQLEVYWPMSQTTQVFHNVPADQAIEVTEFENVYRPLHWSPVSSASAR
jgi:hypothetical protein